MQNVLLLIPDFALILLGAELRRWMRVTDSSWSGTEQLMYYVLFPALIFSVSPKRASISRRPRRCSPVR